MLKLKLALFMLVAMVSGVTVAATTGAGNTASSTLEGGKHYVSDATITTKVKSQLLLNKKIKSLSISVTTDGGVVTLSGIVNNPLQKREALRIAHKVEGVKKVKDELIVNAKPQ